MSEEHKSGGAQGFTFTVKPVQAFLGGVVGGVLVLCTIGFFILLAIVLGGDNKVTAGGDNNPTPLPTPSGNEEPVVGAIREVDPKTDHIAGNKDAKVTIIEYSDFECPFCGRFAPSIDQVLEKYGKDVRVVYRHFPLRSIHPQAAPAANASECAAEQGKFWEFHDELFANQESLSIDFYKATAKKLKLNEKKFAECVDGNKYASKVQNDEKDAAAAGARGTPYSVIIGKDGSKVPVNGALPFESVEASLLPFLN